MKRISITILLSLLVLIGVARSVSDDRSLVHFHIVDSLAAGKDFFAARDYYAAQKGKMGEFHQLWAEAVIDNAFNRLAQSNQKINTLFEKYDSRLTDSVKYVLYDIKQSNHSKLYEYRDALEAQRIVLNRYSRFLKKSDREDAENSKLFWQLLANQPKQTVELSGDTRIPIVHDKLGLSNLMVGNGKDSMLFVFDTGANMSVITESKAAQYGVVCSDSVVDINSITGKKVKAKLGICPLLSFGNVKVYNSAFIVFPDSVMLIHPVEFQINGVIGFPIMSALKEIQLTQADELVVPKITSKSNEQNMALNDLSPLIRLNNEVYTFDTGASSTMLYEAYFNKHKKEIEGVYHQADIKFGGAGGAISKRGYQIIFIPTVNNERVRLSKVEVLTKNVMDGKEDIYGNVGQDLIKKFYKMTLNFESMFIKFE